MSPRSREDIEQFVRENGDREVWVGIANPKGTENDDNSTFLSESQLERICEFLPGVPLHIDHIVYDKETGEKIEPAGTVLQVRDATGALISFDGTVVLSGRRVTVTEDTVAIATGQVFNLITWR